MAEVLGIGLTHFPGLAMIDTEMTFFLRNTLRHGRIPEHRRSPANWPAPMRAEWGNDEGASAAAEHRRRSVTAIRRLRSHIDSFRPDAIVLFGDDQYENFVEDIVPPFCIFILDQIQSRPYRGEPHLFEKGNFWGEPNNKLFVHRGHPEAARFLANRLSQMGMDLPYAYRLRHSAGLGHAFINTLLYFDFDRTGFDYPIIPIHVNCYGGELIRRRGGLLSPGQNPEAEPDPPSPSARACFEVGRAVARAFMTSRYRVAIVASSSWSHAFLTAKNDWLYPDHESDRQRLMELESGDFSAWRELDRKTIEEAGQHEFLNWVCLAGAMSETGSRAEIVDYLESYILNSDKCFAVFPPA